MQIVIWRTSFIPLTHDGLQPIRKQNAWNYHTNYDTNISTISLKILAILTDFAKENENNLSMRPNNKMATVYCKIITDQ